MKTNKTKTYHNICGRLLDVSKRQITQKRHALSFKDKASIVAMRKP